MSILEVDGSHGEGGGQIFRLVLALSALMGQEVRVTNIRSGRPNPGLASQHLTVGRALAELSQAEISGLKEGSREVVFRPSTIRPSRLDLDVGTAGSVTLVLQALLLPALFGEGPVEFKIRGGTDVKWSPPVDYMTYVFLPLLGAMGGRLSFLVRRRGYYPRGGGVVEGKIEAGTVLLPFVAEEPGALRAIRGRVHVANLPGEIAARMEHAARQALKGYAEVHIEEATLGPEEAVGRGGALVLWGERDATRIGVSALAEKGVPAENLGREASDTLRRDLEAGVTLDRHAADQLLPYMALARSPSAFIVREVSGHLRTLFWLLPKFLKVKFLEEPLKGFVRVEVKPSRT